MNKKVIFCENFRLLTDHKAKIDKDGMLTELGRSLLRSIGVIAGNNVRMPQTAYDSLVELYEDRGKVSPRETLGITIGDNVVLGDNVSVDIGATISNNVTIMSGASISQHAVVRENTVIGDNAVIANSTVIPAYSVVTEDTYISGEVDLGKGTIFTNSGAMPMFRRSAKGELEGNLSPQAKDLLRSMGAAVGSNVTMHATTVADLYRTYIANNAPLKIIIGDNVTLGANVSIGHDTQISRDVTVQENTRIGNDCIIYESSTIGEDVTIGNEVTIYPSVAIFRNSDIGNKVTIGSNVILTTPVKMFDDIKLANGIIVFGDDDSKPVEIHTSKPEGDRIITAAGNSFTILKSPVIKDVGKLGQVASDVLKTVFGVNGYAENDMLSLQQFRNYALLYLQAGAPLHIDVRH